MTPAARPARLPSRQPATGLPPGEKIGGLVLRQKNDAVSALTGAGCLDTPDAETAGATLAIAGSKEGEPPVASPHAGRPTAVGPLNVGPFETASLDIRVHASRAFAELGGRGGPGRWGAVDLATGRGAVIGLTGGPA
ncbi:MAG: hypothetical protein Fur0014_06270 [Rubrivivax sp.]